MSETNQARPACDLRGIREAVCVDTSKITDSCLAKDCIEDLRVYLTVDSQCTLDHAVSVKARFVELLHVGIRVEPVPYNTGYYTLDATFYYRVVADASVAAGRPAPITGLAVFSKRLVLFGGDSGARVFSSRDAFSCGPGKEAIRAGSAPRGVVEVVDPMILASGVGEPCGCCMDAPELPQAILDCFDGELVVNGECKRLCVTIGQFSITRLERDAQLLVPVFAGGYTQALVILFSLYSELLLHRRSLQGTFPGPPDRLSLRPLHDWTAWNTATISVRPCRSTGFTTP
jgi:hypothetical protein